MVMATFASAIDLGTALQAAGIDPVVGNTDELNPYAAQLQVENATRDIQAVAGWSILQETVTGYRVRDWSSGLVNLPTLRLTALSLSLGGSVMAADSYEWDETGLVELRPGYYPWTTWPESVLLATFTHGWVVDPNNTAAGPPGLRSLCLDLAISRYDNPTRLQSSSNAGAYDMWRADVDLEKDPRLDPYRLYVVA